MADHVLSVALQQSAGIPLAISFTAEAGQVVTLFGPSGSGKTTILRAIAGLHTPQVGRVTMSGDTWLDTHASIDVPAHRRRVGFVFQDYALFPHLTALGNVMASLGDRPHRDRRRRAEELLEMVHLRGHASRHPATLSGGERQRVAVARALARDPQVLLLDEPFAAVDRALRRVLHAEIDDIRRSLHIPIVLVTHDFDDVIRLASHLVMIRDGQLVAAGELGTLTSRPDLSWLRETAGLGAILDATVVETLPDRGLARLEFAGGVLLTSAAHLTRGTKARVRIPAREVILAAGVPTGLSVHNVLETVVTDLSYDPDSDVVVVQLAVGPSRILAEVTRDAVARLAIAEGVRVHALIKSVSLEVSAS